MRIRELAPGKINLCLFLGRARDDGRHELVTLFESVSLADELVISEASVDEVVAPGVEGPNLVSDAVAGLRRLGWEAPPLRIEIDKRIPIAAGMGGGSADAAALLRLAPRIAPVDAAQVAALAASLGADVPAQLIPGVVLGTGAGDVISAQAPLAAHAVIIVPLHAQLSTPDVYMEADRLGLPRSAEDLAAHRHELETALAPGARLPDALAVNDLGAAACSLCPAIEERLAAIREVGADHVLVCGSGPTAAGVFWGAEAEARAGDARAGLVERFARAAVALPVSSPS